MKFRWFFCLIVILMIVPFAYSATVFVDPNTQVSPLAGKTITLNINAKDVADLYGFQIELDFDKTAMKLVSVEEGDFLKSDGAETRSFLHTESGKNADFKNTTADILLDVNNVGMLTLIDIRLGNIKGVDGAGTLLGLKFEVIEAKESKIVIKNALGDPKINPVLVNSNPEEIVADLVGKTIAQPPACAKGDVNNNGNIQSNDAILALRISAELLIPDAQQLCAADMNDDGKVRANDAIAILRKVAGLAPDRTPIIASAQIVKDVINARLDDAYGIAGQTITVPLKIDGSGIVAGGDISIAYDSSVLNVVEISSDPDTIMVTNTANSGIIKIAFVGSSRNTLAEIKFNVISDNTSPLTIRNIELYESNLSNLKVRKLDGFFGSWAVPAKETLLLQNFPNPFNPETWIPYQLKLDSEVSIKIYRSTGELVRELSLGQKPAGMYISQDRSAYWDGKDKFGTPVASGVYFYTIKTNDFSAIKKLTILK